MTSFPSYKEWYKNSLSSDWGGDGKPEASSRASEPSGSIIERKCFLCGNVGHSMFSCTNVSYQEWKAKMGYDAPPIPPKPALPPPIPPKPKVRHVVRFEPSRWKAGDTVVPGTDLATAKGKGKQKAPHRPPTPPRPIKKVAKAVPPKDATKAGSSEGEPTTRERRDGSGNGAPGSDPGDVADTPEPETARPPIMFGVMKVRKGKSYSTRVTGRYQDPHQYWAEFMGVDFTCVQPTSQLARFLANSDGDACALALRELRDDGLASGNPVEDLVAANARLAMSHLVGRMEDLALEDELFYRLAKLPHVLLWRGGQLVTALAHHAQVWPTSIAHRIIGGGLAASALRAAFSTLPKGERYWVHTVIGTKSSGAADGTVVEVRATFTVVKTAVGFGRYDWVCQELLAYLQKYAFLRPRSTALLAMLHARSIIWSRENRVLDVDLVKFQASTIVSAMRLSKTAAIAQEELSTRHIANAVITTMADSDFLETVDTAVINGYLLSPVPWMAIIYQSLSVAKRKLWVGRAAGGKGCFTYNGNTACQVMFDRGIDICDLVLRLSPVKGPIRFTKSCLRRVRFMFLEQGVDLPATKSKEYFT